MQNKHRIPTGDSFIATSWKSATQFSRLVLRKAYILLFPWVKITLKGKGKLFHNTEGIKKSATAKLNADPCMQISETCEKCVTVKGD
jgi:hypothetical protein